MPDMHLERRTGATRALNQPGAIGADGGRPRLWGEYPLGRPDGEIVDMEPPTSRHATTVTLEGEAMRLFNWSTVPDYLNALIDGNS